MVYHNLIIRSEVKLMHTKFNGDFELLLCHLCRQVEWKESVDPNADTDERQSKTETGKNVKNKHKETKDPRT